MRFLFLIIVLSVSFTAFSQKENKDLYHYGKLTQAAKEISDSVFLITSDSVRYVGKKFKDRSKTAEMHKLFQTKFYFEIDGIRYKRDKSEDIIAWQDEDAYYVYYPADIYEHATRLLKGKINLYKYTRFEGGMDAKGSQNAFYYFMLEKDRFKFVPATFSGMETMFADNPAVLQKYHELYSEESRKGKHPWPKQNTVKQEHEIYVNMIDLVRMYNSEPAHR